MSIINETIPPEMEYVRYMKDLKWIQYLSTREDFKQYYPKTCDYLHILQHRILQNLIQRCG